MLYNATTFEATVDYTCDVGYQIHHDSTTASANCSASGEWSFGATNVTIECTGIASGEHEMLLNSVLNLFVSEVLAGIKCQIVAHTFCY